jgi:sirohydrochlorin cobaltochelatase
MKHIVLFAHGARDPEWARPIEAMRDRVAALSPQTPVTIAFLEFMQPDLIASVDGLAGRGAIDIIVVPVFLAQGGHLKRELPEMVATLRQKHPQLRMEVLPAIGEQPAVIEAIAGCVAQIAQKR